MGVSENGGTPKSSILIGYFIINHPFWGPTPIFGNTHMILVMMMVSEKISPLMILVGSFRESASRHRVGTADIAEKKRGRLQFLFFFHGCFRFQIHGTEKNRILSKLELVTPGLVGFKWYILLIGDYMVPIPPIKGTRKLH